MTARRAVCLLASLACANANMHSSGACPCKYQGSQLATSVYNNYPQKDPANCIVNGAAVATKCKKYPGMYQTMAAIKMYGTTCAAWDQMPDTPWYSYCTKTKGVAGAATDWAHNDFNWCQQPWCYVDSTCTGDKVASSVFKGSDTAFYSYHSCGHHADCYSDIAWNANYKWPTGCPYNPHGSGYHVHEMGACQCRFQGAQLSSTFYMNHPSEDPAGCQANNAVTCKKTPGMYKNFAAIKYYGTTCAAWDQMPGTPWYKDCPANSDWCHYDFNWCQQPWCYVNNNCASRVATSVFKGSTVAFYSYDTCLDTPNCYSDIAWKKNPSPPAACPFDYSDNKWHTAKTCTFWTGKAPVASHGCVAAFAGFAMALASATFLM